MGLYFAPQLPRGFDHFYWAGRGGEPPPPHSAGRGGEPPLPAGRSVQPCQKDLKASKMLQNQMYKWAVLSAELYEFVSGQTVPTNFQI